MQIDIEVTEKRKKKASVTLPAYRKSLGDSDYTDITTYMRVDEVTYPNTLRGVSPGSTYTRLREVSIAIRRDYDGERSVEITIEPNYHFDGRDPDYALGLGEHASTAEEFESALRQAEEFLAECRKVSL